MRRTLSIMLSAAITAVGFTLSGAQQFATIRSYLATTAKNGVDALTRS